MIMILLQDNKLEISRLAQIYNNTVATYKFYWFLSILDIVVKEQRRQVSVWEIIVGMITEAWYPIHYFRLSFGKSDSLFDRVITIQQELNVPIDINKNELKAIRNRFLKIEIDRTKVQIYGKRSPSLA